MQVDVLLEGRCAYTVRESARAKRIILRVTAGPHLEVIVPRGVDLGRLAEFLRSRRTWISRALDKFKHMEIPGAGSTLLPETIHLQAVNRTYSVRYEERPTGMLELSPTGDDGIVVKGEIAREDLGRRLLQQWLREQARHHLFPWLSELGRRSGFKYTRAQIRDQRSRWGSCSSKGTISLNQKLIFLPPAMVQYVMLHELCHTCCLDHSPQFWNLVSRFEPHWKELDGSLNRAAALVPEWAR